MAEIIPYIKDIAEHPEKATGHLLSLLGLIPGGGLVKDNIREYMVSKRTKHVEEMLRALAARIRQVEAEVDADYVDSDEYTHLLVHGITRSQYEHRGFKLSMMGFILAEMTTARWQFTFDVKQLLFDALADMGEHHLQLLYALAKHGMVDVYAGAEDERSLHSSQLLAAVTCLEAVDEARKHFVVASALEWLAQRGLVERINPRAERGLTYFSTDLDRKGSLEAWRHSITPLGLDLYRMISSAAGAP